jgi:hypothetical protein
MKSYIEKKFILCHNAYTVTGLAFAMAKSIFAGAVENLIKTGKNRQKPAKNWKTRSMLLVLGLQLFLAVQKG